MQISTLLFQLAFVVTGLIAYTAGDTITIEAEKLVDWLSCNASTTLPQDIRDAWDSAMDIAYVSKGKIDWGTHSSIDFLGGPTRNAAHQSTIKAVLNNAYTFRRRYWWNPQNWSAWKTSIRCDDPHGLCAKYRTAAAYVINPGKRKDGKLEVTKDTIVICPRTFNSKPTCAQTLKSFGRSGRSDLNNFQCRGYVILHELFHLDSLSSISDGGHIEDLAVRYASGEDPVIKPHQAYGPTRTRVLALWPKDDVGQFVVTNADSLAQYSLSRWASVKNGLFPNLPQADGTPDTTYNPRFFNTTDAADDPTFDGYIEDDTDDPGFDTTAYIGPNVLLELDPEQYIDCNNNGNIEWATAPSVSQAFAESTVETFCNNINNQNTEIFSVPDTANNILFLGAILQIDDPTCTSLTVSPSACIEELGNLIHGCDANSTTRKYGGVSATECISWVMVVNGTSTAVAEPDQPWSCSLLVTDDSLQCACTDGGLYPLLNETCAYSPPSSSTVQNAVLRVLPLGDSITYGYQSTDGNGYRLELFNDLAGGLNNTVDFVGSVHAGTMADNYNEGHSGATIDEIASFATQSLSQRPNVVLIHAGTNDMNLPLDPTDAPTRLGNLIDTILATCPDALVIVAEIIQSGTVATEENIVQFNAAIPSVVAQRVANGFKVLVVDMFANLIYPDDYADDLHPNDAGYVIMGNIWYKAMAYADTELNWISPPVQTSSRPGLIKCANLPTWYPQGEIANGAGLGANEYPDIVCTPNIEDPTRCACANADGSGIVTEQILVGDSCAGLGYDMVHAVHFADLNGDGRAEYLWVDQNGEVTAFLNLGSASGEESDQGAAVQWLPQGVIASGIGAQRQEVQFADLNGDGRAEYLWVHSNGSVEAWLNLGGPNDGPNAAQVGWLYNGFIATGIGAPGSSISFADINGDGRADFLSTDANGAVTCYLNLGPTIDDGPHAAIVGWLPQGVIATGVGGVRNNTVFADINGDGRADYLEVTRSGSGSVNEWLNGGGPNDGPNAAQVVWYPQGSITTGDGTSGANVIFADLNGDGRAEYIEVDPNTSAITVYMNACPS